MQYKVIIAGPDDVCFFDNELSALRFANEINKQYLIDRENYPENEILCVVTVHEVKQ